MSFRMSFDGGYSPCIISLSNLDRCRRRRGAETRRRRAKLAEVDGRTRERGRERERRGVLVCRPRPSNRQSVERARERARGLIGGSRHGRWPPPPLLLQSAPAASEAASAEDASEAALSFLLLLPSLRTLSDQSVLFCPRASERASGAGPKTNAGRAEQRNDDRLFPNNPCARSERRQIGFRIDWLSVVQNSRGPPSGLRVAQVHEIVRS